MLVLALTTENEILIRPPVILLALAGPLARMVAVVVDFVRLVDVAEDRLSAVGSLFAVEFLLLAVVLAAVVSVVGVSLELEILVLSRLVALFVSVVLLFGAAVRVIVLATFLVFLVYSRVGAASKVTVKVRNVIRLCPVMLCVTMLW